MDGSISGPIKIKRSRPVLVADEIKKWVVKKDLKSGCNVFWVNRRSWNSKRNFFKT